MTIGRARGVLLVGRGRREGKTALLRPGRRGGRREKAARTGKLQSGSRGALRPRRRGGRANMVEGIDYEY